MYRPNKTDLMRAARALVAFASQEKVVRWLRAAVPVAILAFLLFRLTQVGWVGVWGARPASLTFYGLALIQFIVVPYTDLIIYRYLWRAKLPPVVLFRKSFLNYLMLNYSGEAYFFLWVREHLRLDVPDLVHAIKDNNILSSGAALVTAALAFLLLLTTGALSFDDLPRMNSVATLATALIPVALCAGLFFGARGLTTLTRPQIVTVFAAHLVRSTIQVAFDFCLLWMSGAMPGAAICLRFVVLRLVIGRLPLPGTNLIFLGVGLEAARSMHLQVPAVAAALLIIVLANQVMNVALVGLPWLLESWLGGNQPKRARYAEAAEKNIR